MSTWTLYGKEYDLSQFLKRHPGGELALLLGQGRDCTRGKLPTVIGIVDFHRPRVRPAERRVANDLHGA